VSAHGGLDVSVAEVSAERRSRVVSRPTWPQHVNPRIDVRCEGCGYGAVVRDLPERCPMCGRATWIEARTVKLRSRL
jgi:rubrerythrin